MPTTAQVCLAIDVLSNFPEGSDLTIHRYAMDVVQKALGEPGWTGATENCKPYGEPPAVDDVTAAKVLAFDKIASLLFMDIDPAGNPIYNEHKYGDTIDRMTLEEVLKAAASAVPEFQRDR